MINPGMGEILADPGVPLGVMIPRRPGRFTDAIKDKLEHVPVTMPAMRYAIFNPDETLRIGPEKELKSFINKIHTIGNALVGAQVQEVRGIRPRWPVQAACFKRGKRRLLMLISHDMKNTQNQKIVFPQLNADCVIKVIDCVSGDSFVPQSSGEIELPLYLEPDDASLFEVFAQPASDPD